MSFETLLDCRVRVWRPVEGKDADRVETRTYRLVYDPAAPNGFLSRSRQPVADTGPGFTPQGQREMTLTLESDVTWFDVLEVVAGPEGHALYEVGEQPSRPRGHHIEARVRSWNGTLPAEGS